MAGTKGMKTGGRNRKAKVLHLAQGTARADRHTRPDVQAPAGDPAMPMGLAGAAADEWQRVTAKLREQGTLSSVDAPVLENYCKLHALVARLETEAAALTTLTFDKVSVGGAGIEHREPKVHPLVAQIRSGRMALRQYLIEFGLTPASRTRVTPTAPAAPAIDPRKARYGLKA